MVRRAYAQRSVFEILLPDGDKLWAPELRAIDELLDDEDLVDLVAAALRRHPLSGARGRLGTPAAVVLRMLLLKHLHNWSFDECEREVRASLVYRAFCPIDCERVPDAKTLIRLAQLLGPETLTPMLERVVQIARQRRVNPRGALASRHDGRVCCATTVNGTAGGRTRTGHADLVAYENPSECLGGSTSLMAGADRPAPTRPSFQLPASGI